MPQLFRDHADAVRIGDHADLDGIRHDIREYRIKLRRDKRRRNIQYIGDAERILRGQRRDDGHRIAAVDRDRLDIRLNACAADRIRSGDGQNLSDHLCTSSRRRRCAAALISFCAKIAETTAIPAMPEPRSCVAFSSLMPPIATTGTVTAEQICESNA